LLGMKFGFIHLKEECPNSNVMKTRLIIRVICILVFTSSCTVKASNSQIPISSSDNPSSIPVTTIQPSVTPDGFYFIKHSSGPPYSYSMAYAPIECQPKPQKCTEISILFDFPHEYTDLSGSILNWSPDGTRAIFVTMRSLLSYKPPAKEFETLATDISITSNVTPWSPDQHWIALSIQDTSYSNHILLFDPATYEKRTLLPDNERLLFIYKVEWKNNNELLVEVHDNGDPSETETKKDVQRKFLALININTNTWTEIEEIPLN